MRMPSLTEFLDLAVHGIPGEFLLLFTVLIWVVFALILFSDPRNRLNLWCFISGMTFSIGALKEFLFYTLGPELIRRGVWSEFVSQVLYSVLSAAFYYLSMPAVLFFCLYFHQIDRRTPVLFHWLRLLLYLPALVFALRFPWTRTLFYQHEPVFCLSVALYNWCCGIAATAIVVHALREERLSNRYRQRCLAAGSVLVPLWSWLISAFPYHALGIPNLSKIWQLNLAVVLCVLFYFLYHAFRDGIWGLRFRREPYDWTGSRQVLQKNAHYVGHALKNDLSKIEWCAGLLEQKGAPTREVAILRQSAAHLKEFIDRTQLYANVISLTLEPCDVEKLLAGLRAEFIAGAAGDGIEVEIGPCDPRPLYCDRLHLAETLRNLMANAADAMEAGSIRLSYENVPAKGWAKITVIDSGCGMDREAIRHLFEPYYTTKPGERNMGLGLYYCWNVMNAHGGSIQVESRLGEGSVFILHFPQRRRPRRKEET